MSGPPPAPLLPLLLLPLLALQAVSPAPAAHAQGVSLAAEQSDYFFTVGEQALLEVTASNHHGRAVSGTLQYMITPQDEQGGASPPLPTSRTEQFTMGEGDQTILLSMDTSNVPATMEVVLTFSYAEGGDITTVTLGPLMVHFVSEESQKDNQPNPVRSSSSSSAQSRAGQQQQPGQPAGQQQQRQPGQPAGQGQQQGAGPAPPDPAQRLQNNQLSQDSAALRRQIHDQLRQQDQLRQEFAERLSSDPGFAAQHGGLLQDGYEPTRMDLDQASGDTGSFDVRYQNREGEWASLQGDMRNGTVTELQRQTQGQQDAMLDMLRQDGRFQDLHGALEAAGFSHNATRFLQTGENRTDVTLQYENPGDGEAASIVAVFEDDQILSVELADERADLLYVLLLAAALAAAAAALVVWMRLRRRGRGAGAGPGGAEPAPGPPGHASESRMLAEQARAHYARGEHKEAFAVAGQAMRLFLSREIGATEEMTNEELVRALRRSGAGYPDDEIQQCLGISALVEFAKLVPADGDFGRVVSLLDGLLGPG